MFCFAYGITKLVCKNNGSQINTKELEIVFNTN